MRSSILSLSEEILVHIIDSVDDTSVLSLALVSKDFNRLTTQRIYRNVQLRGFRHHGSTYLMPFTFLMLCKPEIAVFVRSFCIRDEYPDTLSQTRHIRVQEPMPDPSRTDKKGWPSHPNLFRILRKAVKDVENDLTERTKLLPAILNGTNESAILSILLPKLLHLQKLDFAHGWVDNHDDRQYLLRVLRKAGKREAPFDHTTAFGELSDVLISASERWHYGDYPQYPNMPDWVGAYTELPAIRRVHGYRVGSKTEKSEEEILSPTMAALGTATSTVQELELRSSELPYCDIKRTLEACKDLKTLIHEAGHEGVRSSKIRKAIASQYGCLENLVLEHEHYFGVGFSKDTSPISFAAFEKLAYLKVSTLYLGGSDRNQQCSLIKSFPVSLQTLHVKEIGDPSHCQNTLKALLEVVEQKERLLPRLSKLILDGEFKDYFDLDLPRTVKAIVLCATRKGVETLAMTKADGQTYFTMPEKTWGLDGSIRWQKCHGNLVAASRVVDTDKPGWYASGASSL